MLFKRSYLNSNFTLTLGYLNPALNNLAVYHGHWTKMWNHKIPVILKEEGKIQQSNTTTLLVYTRGKINVGFYEFDLSFIPFFSIGILSVHWQDIWQAKIHSTLQDGCTFEYSQYILHPRNSSTVVYSATHGTWRVSLQQEGSNPIQSPQGSAKLASVCKRSCGQWRYPTKSKSWAASR